MRYWLIATLLIWGMLSVIGLFWRPLAPASAQTILLAMSGGCFANWIRNHTCHCFITAPMLLIAGGVFLLSSLRVIHVRSDYVWVALLIGISLAFLLEWRLARRSAPSD